MVTLKELRKNTKKNIPLNWRWMGKISPFFSWIFIRMGLHPNTVSLIWIAMLFIPIYLLTTGNYFYSVIAVGIIFLTMIIDTSDGEMARTLNKTSELGYYLDELAHTFTFPLLYMAVAIGDYVNSGSYLILSLGFMTSFFCMQRSIVKNLIISPEEQKKNKQNSVNFTKKNKFNIYIFEIVNPQSPSLFHLAIILNQALPLLIFTSIFYSLIFLRNLVRRVKSKAKLMK